MNEAIEVKTAFGKLIAPRGFGASYRRIAQLQAELIAKGKPGEVIGMIRDVLGLIGYEASISDVADWDAQKRVEAHAYAYNVHARASDNPIQRHPKPPWLPEPWEGPTRSVLGVESAGPTVVR